ncbi:unnamed protein product [Sphagnum troendelagicum]|uniref:Uncharacterized protein n=1 Tax=Sphagnum troendelagicum TaxID=128251 RepID=A0ABP0U764_9BRYO
MNQLEATEHGGSAYLEEVHAVTLDLIGNRTTAADHEIAALEQQQPGNINNPRADSHDRVDDDAELQHQLNAVHDPAALSSIPEDGPVLAHVLELPREAMNPAADSAQLGESEEAVASEAVRQIEERREQAIVELSNWFDETEWPALNSSRRTHDPAESKMPVAQPVMTSMTREENRLQAEVEKLRGHRVSNAAIFQAKKTETSTKDGSTLVSGSLVHQQPGSSHEITPNQTSLDSLQSRVKELTRKLREAEEKAKQLSSSLANEQRRAAKACEEISWLKEKLAKLHASQAQEQPAKIAAMIQRLCMAECEVVSSRRSVSYYENQLKTMESQNSKQKEKKELQDSSKNCSLNLKRKEKDQLQLQKVAESEKQQQLDAAVKGESVKLVERSGTMSKTSSSVNHNKASSSSATAVITVCSPSNGKKGSKKSKSKTQCKTDDKFNVEDALAFINEKGPARKKANEGPQGSSFFLAAGISVGLISIFTAIFIIGSGASLN